ncbi:hypothetical protein Tco_0887289 [Tanacetum coccineum]
MYSRFKQVEYKGVPPPLSGDYTPRAQEDIDDSLYVYGKHGPQPQSPSPTETNASSIVFSICPSNDSDGELGTVSNANSTVYSSCQSNDSDGEQGTVSDHSVHDDPTNIPSSEQVTIVTQKTQPQVPKPQQTVDPSCGTGVSLQNQANLQVAKVVIDSDVQMRRLAGDCWKTHSSKQPSSTPISKSAEDIMTFRNELDALALKHLGTSTANSTTSTNPVITGRINLLLLLRVKVSVKRLTYDDDGSFLSSTIYPDEVLNWSIHRNKRIEMGSSLSEKARLVAQGHRKKRSDYDEFLLLLQELIFKLSVVFSLCLILWGSIVYQLWTLKSAFLYGLLMNRCNFKDFSFNAVQEVFKYLMGKTNLGIMGVLGNHPLLISWQCKKQTSVDFQSTEAEYVAVHIAFVDKTPVYQSKTKTLIRQHFIRDCYERSFKCGENSQDLNVADLLTKPFDGLRFNYLVVSIGKQTPLSRCELDQKDIGDLKREGKSQDASSRFFQYKNWLHSTTKALASGEEQEEDYSQTLLKQPKTLLKDSYCLVKIKDKERESSLCSVRKLQETKEQISLQERRLLEERRRVDENRRKEKLKYNLSLKRFGEELQTKTPKRLKEEKDDESTKKSGKRRKQMARKGMNTSVDEDDSEDSDKVDEQEEGLNRIVMNRYGLDGPEDKLEKEFWKCLRIMFEEPLSTDSIWSEIGQQKIVSWRYYDTSRVHCLNLESMDVYLLSDRKYPLSAIKLSKFVENEAFGWKDE